MQPDLTCARCRKPGPVADDQTDPAPDELALDSRGLVHRNHYVCGQCLDAAEDALARERATAARLASNPPPARCGNCGGVIDPDFAHTCDLERVERRRPLRQL